MDDYYVYEHYRPGVGLPFYVGAGRGRRAYAVSSRSARYRELLGDLKRVDVRFVAEGLSEAAASALEIGRIAYWRRRGAVLANTNTHDSGKRALSEAGRAAIVATHTGRVPTDEDRAKRSAKLKGRVMSDETRARMSAAKKGKKQSPEMIAARVAGMMGHVISPETRAKIGAANKGKVIPNRGKKRPPE